MNYSDHVERLRFTHPALADEVAAFTGVSGVLAWMQGRGLTGTNTVVDVVGQDEF